MWPMEEKKQNERAECVVTRESSKKQNRVLVWNVQRDVYVQVKLNVCVTSTKIDLDLSNAVDRIQNSSTRFKDLAW